ncbi:Imm26 family immunity protein [Alcanivorax sediminis]|nr:Imm26 family immunity protein [Alcanivorax sediminis]
MSGKKSHSWVPGDVVGVPLDDRGFAYGRIREHGVAFYDFFTQRLENDLGLIISHDIAFSVVVHRSALRRWEKLGSVSLENHLEGYIRNFRQDIQYPEQCVVMNEEGQEFSASPEECIGLERSSVWERTHVEDRLKDCRDGRENVWVSMLSVKLV